MQQLMFEQDEETIELKETFSTLQQEVDFKTKKLRKVCRNTTQALTFRTKCIYNTTKQKHCSLVHYMLHYSVAVSVTN